MNETVCGIMLRSSSTFQGKIKEEERKFLQLYINDLSTNVFQCVTVKLEKRSQLIPLSLDVKKKRFSSER